MRTFPSPSALLARLSPRERRVVLGGAALSAASLVLVLAVLPFSGRWSAREDAIAAKRQQLARLTAVVGSGSSVQRAVDSLRAERGSSTGRVVRGATPALAAAKLQELLRDYAEASKVDIGDVDVGGNPTTDSTGLAAIPVRLTADGDVNGLTELLWQIEHGEKLLIVDELRVISRLSRDDQIQRLSLTLRLRGPFMTDGS
ncbi:MAG: type II secretion system protein GspM [Gemmatimonadota bacterium]|nr:type II secretion system protein GspM [Gemmatimonadota bacterium]